MIRGLTRGAILVLLLTAALVLASCGSGTPPIQRLQQQLKDVPNYSIMLDDMKEQGAFFPEYYHKYRVFTDDGQKTTDWEKVSEEYYRKNEPFLGMALVVKKDGTVNADPQPPGYAYVGDPKYGEWKQDDRGNSFWEFYGKYALLSSLFHMGGRTIFRDDYNMYGRYRAEGRPYFGKDRQYGTEGSYTKREKPNFYARKMERERLRQRSFSDKVGSRVGRTKTGFRSRSGSWGK